MTASVRYTANSLNSSQYLSDNLYWQMAKICNDKDMSRVTDHICQDDTPWWAKELQGRLKDTRFPEPIMEIPAAVWDIDFQTLLWVSGRRNPSLCSCLMSFPSHASTQSCSLFTFAKQVLLHCDDNTWTTSLTDHEKRTFVMRWPRTLKPLTHSN